MPIMMITTDGNETTRLSAHENGFRGLFIKRSDFAALNHELEQRIAVWEVGL